MSEFKKYSNMADIKNLNEGRFLKTGWDAIKKNKDVAKDFVKRHGKTAIDYGHGVPYVGGGMRKIEAGGKYIGNRIPGFKKGSIDTAHRTKNSLLRFPMNTFTKEKTPLSAADLKMYGDKRSRAIERYRSGKISYAHYKRLLLDADRKLNQSFTGNREFTPLRGAGHTIGTLASIGAVAGVPYGLSKFGDDDFATKQIKSDLENKGEYKEPGIIKRNIQGITSGIKGIKNAATGTILVPAKLTSDMIGYVSAFTRVKTPGEMNTLFSKLYERDREFQKNVLSKLDTSTKLRWKKYYATRKASDAVQSVKNAPKPVKIAAGATALGAGAIGAGMLKREIDINRARVYGCDTIENPKQRLRCEYMVAKEDLKESKKFLSKCYDSNNPESCVKIYSQKIREAETKMLEAKKQLNRM